MTEDIDRDMIHESDFLTMPLQKSTSAQPVDKTCGQNVDFFFFFAQLVDNGDDI